MGDPEPSCGERARRGKWDRAASHGGSHARRVCSPRPTSTSHPGRTGPGAEEGDMNVEQLRQSVGGAVITPDDEGYEEARAVYNAMIDRRPAVILQPATAGDVVAGVDFTRDNNLELAVRGGSHSVPGFGTVDDG